MRPAPTWVERLARIGIVAKAIVYLSIGTLATGVALQSGGVLTGGEGVLRLLVAQPMGRLVLAALAFGFAAYTMWLFAQAVVDPDGNGTSFSGIANRLGQIITGLTHIALTWEAARLALGLPGGRGVGIEGLARGALEAPFGDRLLWLAGIVVIVIGGLQVWRGLFGNVRRDWRLRELDPGRHRWAFRLGRFGLATRGIVLAVAGVLVIRAATALDPEEAGGVGDVLARLWAESSPWLLGAVALGLVAYGVFALIEARYRFIPSG
ncbi:MAG TPA: DUF1206 domain-containing protein [Gemmatimonadales bacterium]|nr:DUF1206 domain-containing protein [Gemmatimonadales bacterium]